MAHFMNDYSVPWTRWVWVWRRIGTWELSCKVIHITTSEEGKAEEVLHHVTSTVCRQSLDEPAPISKFIIFCIKDTNYHNILCIGLGIFSIPWRNSLLGNTAFDPNVQEWAGQILQWTFWVWFCLCFYVETFGKPCSANSMITVPKG
jgi:hypothetical protein